MGKYEHDLDMKIIGVLSDEFDPKEFINSLDLSDPEDIESLEGPFKEYGKNLAKKSIKMGEENPDRTYEVLKDALVKTGEMKFPLIPQRYVEIAYLSIQPFKRLWIHSNSPELFSYKLDECSVYEAIKERFGEEAAERAVCESICFTILEEIFSHFDLDMESSLEARMPDDGKCRFRIVNKSLK